MTKTNQTSKMACLINESDLNSNELIDALRNIEIEAVKMDEVAYLQGENIRLRNELLNRHQTRLMELKMNERKKVEALEKIAQNREAESEALRLRASMINASHDMDRAMDEFFHLSYIITSGENAEVINAKLVEIGNLMRSGSRHLIMGDFPDGVLNHAPTYAPSNTDARFCSTPQVTSSDTNDQMEKLLEDIRRYEFTTVL